MPKSKEISTKPLTSYEVGAMAADAIVKRREADQRKAARARRKAMIEAAKFAGIASALGIDVEGIAGQINEAVPRVCSLLEEINERLARIEKHLSITPE